MTALLPVLTLLQHFARLGKLSLTAKAVKCLYWSARHASKITYQDEGDGNQYCQIVYLKDQSEVQQYCMPCTSRVSIRDGDALGMYGMLVMCSAYSIALLQANCNYTCIYVQSTAALLAVKKTSSDISRLASAHHNLTQCAFINALCFKRLARKVLGQLKNQKK